MRVLISLLIVIPVATLAHADTTSNFLSRLYFPFDFGYSFTANKTMSAGGVLKTGLEYRIRRTEGIFVRLNFDNRTCKYRTVENSLTNITKGSLGFTDYMVGLGYRIGENKVKPFGLLQLGVTSYVYPVIYGTGTNLTLSDSRKNSAIAKVTVGLEYYIAKNAAVTIEAVYVSIPSRSIFWDTYFTSGSISEGFTTTLF
jgi:hypothetical protein